MRSAAVVARRARRLLAGGGPEPFAAGVAATFLSKHGDKQRATTLARSRIAAAPAPRGDGVALCWFALAEVHRGSGRPDEAWDCAQRACAPVDDATDPAIVANAVSEAVFIGCSHGHVEAALYMEGLQRLATEHHDRVAEYCTYLGLGMRAMRTGQPADAHLRRAVELADELGTVQRSVARSLFASWALITKHRTTRASPVTASRTSIRCATTARGRCSSCSRGGRRAATGSTSPPPSSASSITTICSTRRCSAVERGRSRPSPHTPTVSACGVPGLDRDQIAALASAELSAEIVAG